MKLKILLTLPVLFLISWFIGTASSEYKGQINHDRYTLTKKEKPSGSLNEKVHWKGSFVMVKNPGTDREETIELGENLVTTAGLQFISEAVAEVLGVGTTTSDFNRLICGDSSSGAPSASSDTDSINDISGCDKALESGYPKRDDTANTENTGAAANAVTWKFALAAGDVVSSDITDWAITITGHGAASPILNHLDAAAQTLTSSDAANVYYNLTPADDGA